MKIEMFEYDINYCFVEQDLFFKPSCDMHN